MKIARQKGMKDIFFEDIKNFQFVEENIRKICTSFNIEEIRTPIVEATELFSRGVGDETDIVNKEMYSFIDKGDRNITLRPELTAGIVRAYIENGFSSLPNPLKFWYIGNMYRYEKMQKGRYREFSQFGLEIFGTYSTNADIESIKLSTTLFEKIGLLDKITLNINSIGCIKCRSKYIEKLKEYLKPNLDKMCDTCKKRYEKNPLRIIDCKEEFCKKVVNNAPMITDNLCDECSRDFESLKESLDNLNICYIIDKKIVRGLDYYNKTVYEYVSKDLGISVGGGGRYDTLVEKLGGNVTPAVGFGIGIDRICLLLKEYNILDTIRNVDIYFISLGNKTTCISNDIISKLRLKNYVVEEEICERNLKSALKYADKINAKNVCIIGDEEEKNNECIIKNMATFSQIKIKLDIDSIENAIKS